MAVTVPTSSDDRYNYEADDFVRSFISPELLNLSPEEYAARHGHEWVCFSFHLYRYRDPTLGAWVRRLGEILFSYEELERWRLHFLTPNELAEVRQREQEVP
jgi:hypothetical protein